MVRGRMQHRNLWIICRCIYHVPLVVSAFESTVPRLISKISHRWNCYELPRRTIPLSTMVLTVQTQHGWGFIGRRNYRSNLYPISTTERINLHQLNLPRIRAVSSIDDNSGDESWESESDEENDDLGESLIATLEDSSYDDDLVSFDHETTDSEGESDVNDSNLVSGDMLTAECERWSIAVKKSISALEKKQFSLEKEFTKAEQLESLQLRGQYLQSYRHIFTNQVQSATVQDWDSGEDILLTLDSSFDSIGDEIDAIFTETKKLKRGKKVVGTLLDQTLAALKSMKEMKNDLDALIHLTSTGTETSNADSNLLQFIQDRLIASARTTNFQPPKGNSDDVDTNARNFHDNKKSSYLSKPVLGTPSSNIRKVISPAGCTILVGRNRQGNEYLSLNLAKKNDIWMHARDTPGAHVLVVQRRGGTFATDDCFQLAANLAAFYSDGRSERKVPVSAAEPKHIQKPRGAPLGAVKLREELRVYSGRPDDVPNEFKEARAISGLSDEYRIKDKSKLRKQNRQQVTEQKQASKRKIKEKAEQQQQKESDKFY